MSPAGARLLAARALGVGMILAGVAIFGMFGVGLAGVAVHQVSTLLDRHAEVGGLMTTLLVAPIIGFAPALLGLVLARNGWRRLRREPDQETDDA